MTLRDKMTRRAQPLLEPGEQIQEIFPARTLKPGWAGYWNELLRTIWIVAATDRNIVVFTTRFWTQTTPRTVASRLPRETQLGHPTGTLFAELLRTIWIVAATDRNIVVFTTRFWTQTTPRTVAARLPRDTQLGHPTGTLFAELNFSMDGRPMLVQRRFFEDVERANARLAGG